MNKHDIFEREIVAWDRVAAEPKRHGVAPHIVRSSRRRRDKHPEFRKARGDKNTCNSVEQNATKPGNFQAGPENDLPRARHLQRSGGDLNSIFCPRTERLSCP